MLVLKSCFIANVNDIVHVLLVFIWFSLWVCSGFKPNIFGLLRAGLNELKCNSNASTADSENI